MDPLIFIVIISVLGPIIGSFLGVLKYTSDRIVYNMLAFAAGIMITISFLELIPEALELSAPLVVVAGIFAGAVFMYFLDRFIPHFHPDPVSAIKENCACSEEDAKKLKRMSRTAKYLIAGIFFHNFPEGMAIAAMQDPRVGITVALAIAIHNIPEGICTSAPYYHATGNKLKAFLLSSSTAIPVLLGFL
ncbi:MAG: ZIP family metal transporter, partial [Nanoarchaeota archaeon]